MYNNVTIIAKSIGILSGCSKQYNGASVNTFIIYILDTLIMMIIIIHILLYVF